MTRRKKIILASVAVFLLAAYYGPPLISNRPTELKISGTIPSGYSLRGVSSYYTESFLCRDFTLSDGSFLSYGNSRTRRSAELNNGSGKYSITLPLIKRSLFCDWNEGNTFLYVGFPSNEYGTSRSIPLVQFVRTPKLPKLKNAKVECVNTYYVFHHTDVKVSHKPITLCRQVPHPEGERYERQSSEVPISISDEIDSVELDISFIEGGPVYNNHEENPYEGLKKFWEKYDASKEQK